MISNTTMDPLSPMMPPNTRIVEQNEDEYSFNSDEEKIKDSEDYLVEMDTLSPGAFLLSTKSQTLST
jgi:hypothetical protein